MTPINVVIVESHQHALEHYHAAIRKQKLFKQKWSMMHFDAHPDLACPRLPAVACFVPRQYFVDSDEAEGEKNLYELLDLSSSGIAEWILPLVIAANLHVVEWIKPEFSTQIPLGHHCFRIGVHDNSIEEKNSIESFLDLKKTAQIKTDLKLPYYLDDDSVVPREELVLAKALELYVTELSDDAIPSLMKLKKEEESWALDICLDYFSCLNPFLKDIDDLDPAITEALLRVMKKARCYTESESNESEGRFAQLTTTLSKILSSKDPSDESTLFTVLCEFFESIEEAKILIYHLKSLIQNEPSKKALPLVLKALPHWNMPHAKSSLNTASIVESLSQVEKAIRCLDSKPFLISIARSTEDEFTPDSVVEFLQEQVLNSLHRIFCDSAGDCTGSSCLNIVKDYGEFEGSGLY